MIVPPFPDRSPAFPRNAVRARYPVPLCKGTGNGNAPTSATPAATTRGTVMTRYPLPHHPQPLPRALTDGEAKRSVYGSGGSTRPGPAAKLSLADGESPLRRSLSGGWGLPQSPRASVWVEVGR